MLRGLDRPKAMAKPTPGSAAVDASLPRCALCTSRRASACPEKNSTPWPRIIYCYLPCLRRACSCRAQMTPGLLSKPLRALPPPAAPHGQVHECSARPPDDVGRAAVDASSLVLAHSRRLGHANATRMLRHEGVDVGRQAQAGGDAAGRGGVPISLLSWNRPTRGAARRHVWRHGSCHTRRRVDLGTNHRARPGRSRNVGMTTLQASQTYGRPGACPGSTLAACAALPAPRTPGNLCSRC